MTYQELLEQCAKDLWELSVVGRKEGLDDKQIQLDMNKKVIEFAIEKLKGEL